jgi:hypothetical protein
MAVKIKIDPALGFTSYRATQYIDIKLSGRFNIMHRKS